MRLADEITIRVAGEITRLRPTLRAAFRLEQRHGFPALFRSVLDGNLGAVADVIAETAEAPSSLPDILSKIAAMPLRHGLEAVTEPVLALICALAGIDEDKASEAADAPQNGKRISFADYHVKLFRLGTGALGWTPETTWNATPAEITEAYRGRVELLQMIFGGESEDEITGPIVHSEAEITAGIGTLKAMAFSGANRGA